MREREGEGRRGREGGKRERGEEGGGRGGRERARERRMKYEMILYLGRR